VSRPLRIAILGLSITSAWGNGHATTFRSLIKGLHRQGHEILFLERDVPWYAANRDLPAPPYAEAQLYDSLATLEARFAHRIVAADLVVLGSYVPDGVQVARWLFSVRQGPTAFYDIDTPVTLAALERGDCSYLDPLQITDFDLYLSFTGGPVLDRLRGAFGARRAHALYCSVDPDLYAPTSAAPTHDLGYLGTYSDDRQPSLDTLLLDPARALPGERFVVAGPQYPTSIEWPGNVDRIEHLPPARHRAFYTSQRFTLNVTRRDMVEAGYAPSVRLFEAAACGTPIISDRWPGLDELFLPDKEILIVDGGDDVIWLLNVMPEDVRRGISAAARRRVLGSHTGDRRAEELLQIVSPLLDRSQGGRTLDGCGTTTLLSEAR
jgi:spore maturation protein CgeB